MQRNVLIPKTQDFEKFNEILNELQNRAIEKITKTKSENESKQELEDAVVACACSKLWMFLYENYKQKKAMYLTREEVNQRFANSLPIAEKAIQQLKDKGYLYEKKKDL